MYKRTTESKENDLTCKPDQHFHESVMEVTWSARKKVVRDMMTDNKVNSPTHSWKSWGTSISRTPSMSVTSSSFWRKRVYLETLLSLRSVSLWVISLEHETAGVAVSQSYSCVVAWNGCFTRYRHSYYRLTSRSPGDGSSSLMRSCSWGQMACPGQ